MGAGHYCRVEVWTALRSREPLARVFATSPGCAAAAAVCHAVGPFLDEATLAVLVRELGGALLEAPFVEVGPFLVSGCPVGRGPLIGIVGPAGETVTHPA